MVFLSIISILFIISSVMPQWVINQGFTIQVYYIFGLLFSFFYTPYFLNQKKVFSSAVNRFFLFLAILLFLRVFSYLGLLIFFSNSSIDFGLMADQYFKSVITNTLNFIILISLAHFLFSQSLRKRELLFSCFLGVVLAGCIYQIIKFYFLIFHQIFLDNIVWPAISINYSAEPFDYNLLAFGYDLSSASSFISLFRVGGFDINPNIHAAQLACIIPF